MDNLLLLIPVIAAVVVGLVIVAAALRSMRPKVPETPSYQPPAPAPQTLAPPAAEAPRAPVSLSPAVAAEIDALVAADHKIQAIKLYREHTGLGLKDSKLAIDHWR